MLTAHPLNNIPEGELVLYDGTCPYCRTLAAVLRRVKRSARVVDMHSPEGKDLLQRLGKDSSQYHIIKDGKVHDGRGLSFAGLKLLLGW